MRFPTSGARGMRALSAVLLVGGIAASATLVASAQQADSSTTPTVAAALAAVASPSLPPLPAATAFRHGDRTIAAGERVAETVATADGSVHVYGTVTGDVVTVRGNIVVHDKGTITGNAIAIDGTVRTDGGTVGGETLVLSDVAAPPPQPPMERLTRQLALVGAWLVMLLVIGIGVLAFASDNLAAVADALERHYGNSLVAGLAGQVAFAPLLVAVVVALVLSLLGILLVPFAMVAYVIIAAGLITLGFLATAVVIGRGWRPAPAGSGRAQRGATLRAMIVGSVVLLAPWLVAALLSPWPVGESVARGVALAVTW
ncbi:MAG TPA: polymer-forming cytoskeletal protein, partial [Gemmatimonadaceae bacterium]|nr:polymer-forming cytoskeletal protein [Gemmatimonadaceae bacterium]